MKTKCICGTEIHYDDVKYSRFAPIIIQATIKCNDCGKLHNVKGHNMIETDHEIVKEKVLDKY